MFDRLGRLIARHPIWIIGVWAAVAAAVGLIAPPFEQRCQDDDIRFLPERCLSVQGHNLLKQAFPQDVFGSKAILVFERTEGPLTPGDLALVDRVVAEIESVSSSQPDRAIKTITWYRDPLIGSRLKSTDGRCTLVMVAFETPFLAFKTAEAVNHLEQRVAPLLEEYRRQESTAGRSADDLRLVTTGPSGIGRDLNDAAFHSLEHTTLATLILVIMILLLVYRSPLLAMVPLVTIGTSVWLSLRILALLSLIPEFQLVNITRIFVVVVLYGAGTDYCLFLISRYREELQQGQEPVGAIRHSLRRVGGALTASAGTVVCGLGMMGFAEFAKLRYTGPAIALSLVVALAASLTLAPALLRLLGSAAFWPRRLTRVEKPTHVLPLGSASTGAEAGFWSWFSKKLAAYPLRTWLITIALLLPFAILGSRTEYVYDLCAELPRDARSLQGLDIIRDHFTAGEIGPLTVLLESEKDWNSPESRAQIAELSRELSLIDNVAEVRSLTQPLGPASTTDEPAGPNRKPAAALAFLESLPLAQSLTQRIAGRHYVAKLPDRNVTRLDIIFRTEPFATESLQTMHAIRAHLDQKLANQEPRYVVYGATAMTHDLADVHEKDRVMVNALVLAGILIILVALVRRPVLAVYLLLTVLFSYYVTIGLTELLSLGWLDSKFGQVDWKVPYFLFTILVAIGEDYNIFLIARVLEESRRKGMHEGTRLALSRTGATITSCGLIMAGTFATMMLCSLTTLIQLGLALSLGVLLDTFIVRPILVPAFLLMLHRRKAEQAAEPQPEAPRPLRRSA